MFVRSAGYEVLTNDKAGIQCVTVSRAVSCWRTTQAETVCTFTSRFYGKSFRLRQNGDSQNGEICCWPM